MRLDNRLSRLEALLGREERGRGSSSAEGLYLMELDWYRKGGSALVHDAERAEVIGKVGAKYLQDPTRRRRLAELVGENEPEERKRAKKRLSELEAQKRTHALGSALHRNVRRRQGLSFAEIAKGDK